MSVDLNFFLALSAGLFGVGCFGLLARRSAMAVLMSAELMLTAAILALVAFSRFSLGPSHHTAGLALATLAAVAGVAELAVGGAIVVVIYRMRRTAWIDEYDSLVG